MAHRVRERIVVCCLTLGAIVVLVTSLAGASGNRASASSAGTAADCQPYGASACLLPFPNNLFTRPDPSTPTALRVQLPSSAMPADTHWQRIAVPEYDRADGFSPRSEVIVHIPGFDNPAAFAKAGAVRITNMSRSFARNQPVVIIDEDTGIRQLIRTGGAASEVGLRGAGRGGDRCVRPQALPDSVYAP